VTCLTIEIALKWYSSVDSGEAPVGRKNAHRRIVSALECTREMSRLPAGSNNAHLEQGVPHILVGVTSAQTCLVLKDRLKALCEAGFRVSLVSAPGCLANQAAQIRGVAAYTVPVGRSIALLADLTAFFRIWRLVRRLRPDIVEFSTPKAGLLGCVAAWLCRVSVRVYLLRGLKLETSTGFKRHVLLWAERLAASCAQITLCNSRSLRSRAIDLRISRPSKLALLGEGSSNGVDVDRFSPGISDVRQRFGIPPDSQVIGFVGRLTADKGIPELLEAFAKVLRHHPNAHLLLVGWFDAAEDALQASLRRRIEGHPRIVHTGYVDDTAPFYRAMDLLILPSWREGFPNAVLEAAAAGIPVIAAACTGSRDAVIPEVTGLLVPPGNPQAISEAALWLIDDATLRAQMARAARKWAVNHYDKRRVMRETVRFYQGLISAASTSTAALDQTSTELSASL
jgi:glycosyltransferase involved in cell wall biosynthesis